MRIEEALSWITLRDDKDVLIELDSVLAVQAINGEEDYQLEVVHTIKVCTERLIFREDFKARHVRRLANRTAYSMARPL